MIVAHQKSKKNGLWQSADSLQVFKDGELISETQCDDSLAKILQSGQAAELFPDLSFSFNGRQEYIDVEIEIDLSMKHLVLGTMISGTDRGLWEAARVRGQVFNDQAKVPEGARSWAQESEKSVGWEIALPAFLAQSLDPVIRLRGACAIESLLYFIVNEKEVDLPYKRRLCNVFNIKDPFWSGPLPLVKE